MICPQSPRPSLTHPPRAPFRSPLLLQANWTFFSMPPMSVTAPVNFQLLSVCSAKQYGQNFDPVVHCFTAKRRDKNVRHVSFMRTRFLADRPSYTSCHTVNAALILKGKYTVLRAVVDRYRSTPNRLIEDHASSIHQCLRCQDSMDPTTWPTSLPRLRTAPQGCVPSHPLSESQYTWARCLPAKPSCGDFRPWFST